MAAVGLEIGIELPDQFAPCGLGSTVLGAMVTNPGAARTVCVDAQKTRRALPAGSQARRLHLLLAAMPLALGSWWSGLLVVPLFPVLVWRILDEEIFLRQNLPGYDEYMQRVRYRLVPRVW
jgi:hypothetical protein